MIRKAFVMTLRPGFQAEYKRRHDQIWPELRAMLKQHGVQNYSIFLDQNTDKLFAYAECESDALWQEIAATAVCQRWWIYMQDVMFTDENGRPLTIDLVEVFHLE